MKPLAVTLIADPHYYSKKNWVDGDPYRFPPQREQQYKRGSEEIIRYVFDEVCRDGAPDIILINGDLTNNGEVTSHEEMRALLRKLKSRGKRVYVTTATHDYANGGNGFSYGFDKDNREVLVPALQREQLYDYYFEFGLNEALSVHLPSMSYTVKLNEDYLLLALNDDVGKQQCGFTDDCFLWIEQQVRQAQANGQFVVAMTHHPVLAPSVLYRLIAPGDVLEDGEETAKRFADLGIPCILTGHSHIHNISSVKSESGNLLYDVSTASVIGYPPYYRRITFDPEQCAIAVSSVLLDRIPGLDTDGLSLSDFTKKLFLGNISDIFTFAETDYEQFSELAIGFSMPKEKSHRLKPVLRPAAKYINRLTFGRIWRFSRRTSAVTRQEMQLVKAEKVLPFAIEMIANLFKGDAALQGTSQADAVKYAIAVGFFQHLDKRAKPFHKKLQSLGIESIAATVHPLLQNDGLGDAEAILHY